MVGNCKALTTAMPPNQKPVEGMNVSISDSQYPSCQRRMFLVSKNLKRESERLKTFQNWPCDFINPRDLAKDGFYYTNESDTVRCAFCGIAIGCWEKGDNPHADHIKWTEKCDFLENKACGNIPLTSEGETEVEDQNGTDICGPYGHEILPYSGPERARRQINSLNYWKDLEHLGVSKTSGPVYPRFSTFESRYKTFAKWPISTIQDPRRMAEAGFYFTEVHDNVVCFHCGGGLQKWNVDDDPWEEHARWFNSCGFVIIQKGKDFVNDVAVRKKAVLPVDIVEALCEAAKEEKERLNRKEEIPKSKKGESTSTSYSPPTSSSSTPSSSCSSSSTSTSSSPPSPNNREVELCRICYVEERAIVFLPCGHFATCVQCSPSLSLCPMCRKPYQATVRAYLS